MGKGLTNELKAAFPDLIPANERGVFDLTLSPDLRIDPCGLAGFILFFIFYIYFRKKGKRKIFGDQPIK